MSAQEWRKYYLISTHAPLAGRDLSTYARYIAGIDISTHAPLAGRDWRACRRPHARADFNPRAPCGARPGVDGQLYIQLVFQPTRPLRGATTQNTPRKSFCWRFQPTRPLRGATRRCCREVTAVVISTHAPLAGRDDGSAPQKLITRQISTHAPLAGRDSA